MPSILQVSDAHLSPRNGLFRGNLDLVRRAAEAAPPDLVVASGDLSLDGAGREPDLAFAAEQHRAFAAPLLALPGNHDVGSEPKLAPHQPVDDARLDRWRRHLGPGRGVVDLPGWRVIGLNSEVMGTGHAEEEAQAAFIAAAAAGAGDRRIALFLHKPPFLHAPEEAGWNPWSVPPEARPALAPLLTHPGLRLVASGHLHLHHEIRRGAVTHVWAPSLSFTVPASMQPGIPGARIGGALLHLLHADHVETRLLAPAGVEAVPMDTVQDQTYPRA
ncbi:metallophosphoesterase family protein [Falsiroseomonas sp.]|uniref:metallophosphoesterase family protein n=1 Tax=Falsiroseomonas sp. TaxID=2870721 RepID=UPI0035657963